MSTELIVPTLGESITDATVSKWLKDIGDEFEVDEPLVEIETEKITVEVSAPKAGKLSEIKVKEGQDIKIGGVLGIINDMDTGNKEKKKNSVNKNKDSRKSKETENKARATNNNLENKKTSPSVRKILEEENLNSDAIQSSRDDGRITKEDVIEYLKEPKKSETITSKSREEVVRMSKMRKTIASRLKESQNTAAILTTFNEVNMSPIIEIREAKNNDFKERYNVKLGFMSFFVKAVVASLKNFPAINAEIRDDSIIYKNHFDIGIAVGTERGLVVPVLKNADSMTFGEIEKAIIKLSNKAKDGSLTMNDLSDGTFTISNGGVYGSMLSTPIINSHQSGILGMHNIQKRAVVINDDIVIRSMMYLALSYDHRIVDGKESVGFLVSVKELLENPSKLILGF
tara:strand:+ start:9090 stop:10289 length:1200 start_codon:yes stop_codon:yes gene_type:complete